MLIEIHMLKNYPATNLNRDDMGAPKSCLFGGVQRGRISSQCLKRSWRVSPIWNNELSNNMGIRTRKMPQIVAERIKEMGVSDEYLEVVQKMLSDFGKKEDKQGGDSREKKPKNDSRITRQVVFYSKEEIQTIVEAIEKKIANVKDVKELEKLKVKGIEDIVKKEGIKPISLDMALFGRMVTSTAFADIEASMQVAHAISTNRVIMESDFFVTMDDMLEKGEELGAGMMDDIDYNSNCYYIYASLDVNKLLENLKESESPKDLVKTTIPALLRTMAYSNPSGKQNTFAGNVLPSAVLVECKDYPVPVSYANGNCSVAH